MNETELLFTEILNCDKLSLYLNKDTYLARDKTVLISSALSRRIAGEPMQYILGKTEFMDLEFKVNRDVFIPRPETEILVERVLKQLSVVSCQLSDINILDVGTGSGCIAVSLAKLLSNMKIAAIDISSKALEIAQHNARLNNVDDKIEFICSDLFTDYRLPITDYDIVVCNPPYIPTAEIESLQPEIRYEPRMALDGGEDGLDFYRKIIRQAPEFLKPDGFLIMEMGFGQSKAIKNIFQDSAKFKIIEIIKDYNRIDRVIVAKNG